MADPRIADPDLFHAVFEVDVRGKAVLEHLSVHYCTAQTIVTSGGIDAVLETYRRAAHREVLDYIHTQIARATAAPRETPQASTGA